MAKQDSTFTTVHVTDNEIVKASDFEYAFEQLIVNVSRATQMFLESDQDFVINGKVSPLSDMAVQVSPIYGVCKSTGVPFGRTETAAVEYTFAGSSTGRVDILEVKGDWETYDNQQRAFNDPDTNVQTYQYVNTKKLMLPVYQIKQGVDGSATAPEVDEGWVKLAEVVIRANATSLLASDIKNITADVAGMDNTDWTTDKDVTYNIGYISEVNERFRVQHNEDGTHKNDVINTDSLNIGIGTKQVNGNALPIGGNVSIPTQTISNTDSIYSVITKAATMITSLYDYYKKYGNYGFKGEVSISDIADSSDILTNPIKLSADGSGNATIKIGTTTALSIDSNGKLSTNGYTATTANHIVTKAVTDAISTALTNLTNRVNDLVPSLDQSTYANGTLSSGTDGRYNIDSISIYLATTDNVTLSGSQSSTAMDNVTSISDGVYILVRKQTDAKQNGIYQYSSSSAWSRVNGYLTPNSLRAKLFNVINGNTNKGKIFYLPQVSFTQGSEFGTDDINFSEYFGSIAAVADKIVVRDSNGKVNSDITGNAATATKLQTARKVYVKLGTASTSETKDFSGDTAIPVDGQLAVANGGTGATDAAGARTNLGLGSASTKTAGSANGNVPLNGAALGTTDNNIVVTNSSGALKPYGTTVPNAMTYGIYAPMDYMVVNGVATISLTTPTGLTLRSGTVLRVTFSFAVENSSAITEVKLTYGGVTKTVKAARGGSLKNVVSHVFTGGDYTSSKPNKVWDKYTTLELMYSGDEWIVMGNPVLCSYFSETQSYTVYANGLIIQTMRNQSGTQNYVFLIQFTKTPTVTSNNSRGNISWNLWGIDYDHVGFYQGSSGGTWDVIAIGY